MNRRALQKYMRAHGCTLARRGRKHDIWVSGANQQEAPVPRHTEIKTGTMRSICRQLEIPEPPGK